MTEFATSSYSAYKADMGVAVRVSCGVPKWWDGPLEYAKEITPWGIFGKKQYDDPARFYDAYVAKLDRTKGKVVREILDIAGRNPDRPLVFLCYEGAGKGWCHREVLASWLEDRTGLDIVELPSRVS